MWCGFNIVPTWDCQLKPLLTHWSRGDGMTGSNSVQMSWGKMLNQDRLMLVRNVPCLSEISLLEGTVPIYTHVTAEIRKLG